jgi:hypothetical protein
MDGHRFNNSHIWNPDRLYEIRVFGTYLYVLVCIENMLVRNAENGTYTSTVRHTSIAAAARRPPRRARGTLGPKPGPARLGALRQDSDIDFVQVSNLTRSPPGGASESRRETEAQ